MKADIPGQVVVIVGTTGIGRATARLLCRRGASVVVVGRTEHNAQQLREEIISEGGSALAFALDVTGFDAARELLDRAVGHYGRCDALYHVAGISGRRKGDGPLAECTDEGWETVLSTNLTAMMRTNRAFINHWLKQNSPGVILNMASVLGFSFATSHFDTVGYATAKAGIIAMTKHAASCYASRSIRLNVIAPGLVDTPMASRAIQSAAIGSFIQRKQPLTRGALSDEQCAEASAFLLGRESEALTGVVLNVDGGWSVS